MKKSNPTVKMKPVVMAKKTQPLSEEEYNSYYSGKTFKTVLESVGSGEYDGQPLSEQNVYTLTAMIGLKILIIKSNRRTFRRAIKMWKACRENGMTTPAILVDAKLAHDWGLSLCDPVSLEEATPEDMEGAYVLMEGHGRLHGWLVDVAIADKMGEDYMPFEFPFIYKYYDSPEDFGKAYTSTNADMTRTTNKDRLAVAADRCINPLLTSYFRKCREDNVISKSSYFWTFGRELTAAEVTKITYGADGAPVFDEASIEALQKVYESFKNRFHCTHAQKIYRGVSAAQWAADQIKKAEDKGHRALEIDEKLAQMNEDVYSAIITASTNAKKKQNKDTVIKENLDKMMLE